MVCSCAKDKNFCHMHQLELLYLKLPIYYTPPPPHPTQPTCKPPCIYKSRAYNWMFIVFVHCCADTRPNTQRMYFLFGENTFAYTVVSVFSVHVLHSFFQSLVLHMKPWL